MVVFGQTLAGNTWNLGDDDPEESASTHSNLGFSARRHGCAAMRKRTEREAHTESDRQKVEGHCEE